MTEEPKKEPPKEEKVKENNSEDQPLEKTNFEEELKNIKAKDKTEYSWDVLKTYVLDKYKEIVNDFPKEGENSNEDEEIIDYINNLNKIPFTLQRIAELLLEPKLYYKTANKYNSAFKKLVNIEPD